MKSLIYLIVILVSFVFLPLFGVLAGGFICSCAGSLLDSFINELSSSRDSYHGSVGNLATFTGAVAGGVIGICWWFKLVAYLVDQENIALRRKQSFSPLGASAPPQDGPFLCGRDAIWGNHMMASGMVILVASLIYFSELTVLTGGIGVVSLVAGFIISLTAYEFPSEEGIWRRIKLLFAKVRT